MEIASFVLSIVALLASLGCLVIMLAKNYFSTHTIQRELVDPFKSGLDPISSEIGKIIGDPFRDLGDPVDSDELEHLENLRKKRAEKRA